MKTYTQLKNEFKNGQKPFFTYKLWLFIFLAVLIGAITLIGTNKYLLSQYKHNQFKELVSRQIMGDTISTYNPIINNLYNNKYISIKPIFWDNEESESIFASFIHYPYTNYKSCIIEIGSKNLDGLNKNYVSTKFLEEVRTNSELELISIYHEISHCHFYNQIVKNSYLDNLKIDNLTETQSKNLKKFIRTNLFNPKQRFTTTFLENFADYYGAYLYLHQKNASPESKKTVERLLYYREMTETNLKNSTKAIPVETHITSDSLRYVLNNWEYLQSLSPDLVFNDAILISLNNSIEIFNNNEKLKEILINEIKNNKTQSFNVFDLGIIKKEHS